MYLPGESAPCILGKEGLETENVSDPATHLGNPLSQQSDLVTLSNPQ